MFVHLFWNALAQLLSMRRPLNDNKYSRVITRNGPVPQVLEDMEIAVKKSRASAIGKLIQMRSILDSVRIIPMT